MSANKRAKKPMSKLKRIISRAITFGCLAVFIYSAYTLVTIFIGYYENRQVLADAQEIYYESSLRNEVADDIPIEKGGIRPQFTELQQINSDIVGWISIEGTEINYPILQSTTNQTYLTHNYKGDYAAAGSIFMDYRVNLTSSSRNTILYGHRMKDGSMFEGLTNFLEQDFFNVHKVVKFDTLYGSYDAEIFAVYQTTTDFDYIQTDFSTDEEYGQLLDEIRNNSIYDTTIDLTSDDQILTLSTCDYMLDPQKGRLVVHAKIVSKK